MLQFGQHSPQSKECVVCIRRQRSKAKQMRLRTSLAIFAALLSMPHRAQADICGDIREIHKQATGDSLSAWAGELEPDSGERESTYRLRGSTECYVDIDDDEEFGCRWLMKDDEQLEDEVSRVSDAISKCAYMAGGTLRKTRIEGSTSFSATNGIRMYFESSDRSNRLSVSVFGKTLEGEDIGDIERTLVVEMRIWKDN